ncbi:PEP-CTERM sorting domain-containing protein [Luteolibacter algae]|uniref:PEP-CTERM sorting domain-containing protein n=1 Tax=Luteolibacter algae TaxID=454151 RepID=A0ABW5D5W3_9BACT
MKIYHTMLSAVCAVVAAGSASAAVSYNFNSETDFDFFTGGGVSGWSQDQANPSIGSVVRPMAFIENATFAGTASFAGHLGTEVANLSPSATTTLTGSLTGAGAVSNSRVSLNFAIADSVTSGLLTRDSFEIAILDDTSSELAALLFTADPASSTTWKISYRLAGGMLVDTASTAIAGSGYFLAFDFSDTTGKISYGTATAGVGTNLIGEGALTSADDLGAINISHIPVAAEGTSVNKIIFDNINAATTVPEPSSALLLALGGLALIRRRR